MPVAAFGPEICRYFRAKPVMAVFRKARFVPASPCRIMEGSILVVDDDHDCRVELREVLEQEGLTVAEAANGQAALDYLVSHQVPSLIILDVVMPAISGLELLTILRRYYRLSRIPVLMLSGHDVTVSDDHGVVSCFLRKPYDVDHLVEAVHRYRVVTLP
jgi:CheY-like chemotaxis protein